MLDQQRWVSLATAASSHMVPSSISLWDALEHTISIGS